jgi:endoglucanase
MLGLRTLFTAAAVGAVVSAGYLPAVNHDAPFRYNARRQVANGTTGSFNGPYNTKGRDIVDIRGEKVTWAGGKSYLSVLYSFRRLHYNNPHLGETY